MVEGLTFGEKIAQRIEVAERFRHLLAFDDQVLGVQPHSDERLSRGCLALRDFILVVREGEIDSAGVNIERVAEVLHRHGRAFNVPAGPAGADARLPEVLARLRRFPERKIPRVFFIVLIDVHARASLNAGQIDLRELPVIGEFGDAVIDRAIACVGEAFLLQALDQRDHVVDMIGSPNQLLGHFDVERVNVLEERLDVLLREFADVDSGGGCRVNNAIIHVGHVHHLHHAIPLRAQKAAQDVLKHKGAEIADVGRGVDRRAAGIDSNLARMHGDERLNLATKRVVESYLGHFRACAKRLL